MIVAQYAWNWLMEKLSRVEKGQGTLEYVLLILAVVLFLIVSAILLRPILDGAVADISSWVGAAGPPATLP